jgi:hypothetical protein
MEIIFQELHWTGTSFFQGMCDHVLSFTEFGGKVDLKLLGFAKRQGQRIGDAASFLIPILWRDSNIGV